MNKSEAQLSKREFVARTRSQQRRLKKLGLLGLFLLVFCFFAMSLADYAQAHGRSLSLFGRDLHQVLVWLFFICMGGLLVVFGFAGRSTKCPNCRGELMGVSAQIAIATGNCGHCGERILTGL